MDYGNQVEDCSGNRTERRRFEVDLLYKYIDLKIGGIKERFLRIECFEKLFGSNVSTRIQETTSNNRNVNYRAAHLEVGI